MADGCYDDLTTLIVREVSNLPPSSANTVNKYLVPGFVAAQIISYYEAAMIGYSISMQPFDLFEKIVTIYTGLRDP